MSPRRRARSGQHGKGSENTTLTVRDGYMASRQSVNVFTKADLVSDTSWTGSMKDQELERLNRRLDGLFADLIEYFRREIPRFRTVVTSVVSGDSDERVGVDVCYANPATGPLAAMPNPSFEPTRLRRQRKPGLVLRTLSQSGLTPPASVGGSAQTFIGATRR